MLHYTDSKMEREMSEKDTPINADSKSTWEAPTIVEIDYARTEAAYVPGAPVDLGIYTV
jgi:hypothetical protein